MHGFRNYYISDQKNKHGEHVDKLVIPSSYQNDVTICARTALAHRVVDPGSDRQKVSASAQRVQQLPASHARSASQLHNSARQRKLRRASEDMSSASSISPMLRAWYRWKALRLPWRKRFLVGTSLPSTHLPITNPLPCSDRHASPH
jgi:hypothetical protein